MTASLVTLTNAVTGAATPPGGGGIQQSSAALSVLWQVTATLKGVDFPLNDGQALVDQTFLGVVTLTPQFNNGFLIGYADEGVYSLQVPFLDELFMKETPLTPPYAAYYLITEHYAGERGFGTDLVFPSPKAAEPFVVVRKVRPLSANGPVQFVSACLV